MDRVDRIAWMGAAYAFVLTVAPVLAIFASERYALMIFLPADSPSLPIAQHLNAYVLWSFIPFALAFIFSGVVRATGAVWPPLLFMIVAMWGVRIPFAYGLMPRLGVDAVWISFPLASAVMLVFALAYYRLGNWRSARLLPVIPHGDVPDGALSPPSGVEETEAHAEARTRRDVRVGS